MTPEIDLVSGEWWGRDPHDELAWLRANDPVHYDERNGVWGITKYDDVRWASTHAPTFSNASGIRPTSGAIPMMIDMDEPEHWQRRKLVNRGFTPQRIREQEPVVRSVADRLIDRICERGECDFVWDVAAWLPLIMIGDALGFGEADHPTLLKWSDDLLKAQGNADPELMNAAAEAAFGYSAYIAEIIADRRENPRDDLVSLLVHAEIDGDRLSEDALHYETLLILIGGDETTRHVISGGLYQMLVNRQHWEDVRADRSLLPAAVEEMLRWVTPIKNMARTITADVELRGRTLRAGDQALLLYPSANRDEDHFSDPMRFDIRRSPNDHLAFGVGTHFCLGQALARLELTVLFDRLLDRLGDIELVDDTEPAFRPANFVSGYESMPVRFTPSESGVRRG